MKYKNFLASIENLSPAKKIKAVKFFGGAQSLYKADGRMLKASQVFEESEIERLMAHKASFDLEREYERCLKKNIKIISYDSKEYPAGFNDISNKPYAVYLLGNLPDSDRRSVSIVGARKCTEYGRTMANKLGAVLAGNGINVISGMASGIDSASHAGALSADGKTFAVLGCGVDVCYPTISRSIYNNIIESGGGIISEYPPGSQPVSWHFPSRNRLISAFCNILVIIEAKEKSGSLITTDFALEQGREIYALPGRIGDNLSKGCNKLIAQGCGIIWDLEDFAKSVCNIGTISLNFQKLDEIVLEREEMLVYSVLDLYPKHINQIIEETHLNFLMVFAAVDTLLTNRHIKEVYPNYYCRCE